MLNNQECTLCARHKKCKNVGVSGVGSGDKLMIVLDYPFTDTNTKAELSPFLEEIISGVVNIPMDAIYVTYAVKCNTDKIPTTKEIKDCTTYLKSEIETIQPKAILTLGEISMNAVCGTKKISSMRGKQQVSSIVDTIVPVISTYAPFYVQTTMSFLEVFANDILKAWNLAQGVVTTVSTTNVIICDDFDKIREAVKYCMEVGVCSFDFETKAIDKELVTYERGFFATTLSLTFQAGSAYVIPLEHSESPFSREEVDEIMVYVDKYIFNNPRVRKIAHNLKYDCHVARVYGTKRFRGRLDDTMLMYHLIDETEKAGLKHLVDTYLPEFSGYEDELEGVAWDKIPLRTLAQYNGTDTDLTYRLCVFFEKMLQEDKRLYLIYRNLTMAAFKPLWEAECRGMDIDRDYLKTSIDAVEQLIDAKKTELRSINVVKRYERAKREALKEQELEKLYNRKLELDEKYQKITKHHQNVDAKIAEIKMGTKVLYESLNFASPPQLNDILYNHPEGFRFTNISGGTGKDVLEDIMKNDDTGFIKKLLELRSMEKMQGTYLKGIMKRLDEDNRVHTTFNLNGTASGRLSSSNPNLQNMPNPYKLEDETLISIVKMVKTSFIPPKGNDIVQIDYAQAELRVIASFANEDTMLGVYREGKDLHALTAANTLHLTLDEFYKLDKGDQKAGRQRAKAVNFGFIYGMSASGFQEYAKNDYKVIYTLEESEKTRDTFFRTYPKLLDYHRDYIEKGRKYGWVRTLFGRRRRLPDINNWLDDFKRTSDERIAVNSPIQGTAGEMTVFAIALLYNRLPEYVVFINTIHDSIMFYMEQLMRDNGIEIVRNTCENLPTQQYFGKSLRIGMKVDAEASSECWANMREL